MNSTYKKLILAFLAACIALGTLAGCGKAENSGEPGGLSGTVDVTPTAPNSEDDVFGSGDIDPENAEIFSEDGASVNASELHNEDGRTNGIDVSKWQGKIDWQAVAAEKIDFAFIRIGYRGENGVIYKDDNADYNIQNAAAAGIPVGVYFFSTAVNKEEAVEEAKWTVNAIEGYPISYPVVYDCEGFRSSLSRMYKVTAEERTENAVAFLSEVSSQGYEAMLYGALTELSSTSYWNTSKIESSYKIWVAKYPAVTYPAVDKPDCSISIDGWQYTNKGKVSGIAGDVDMVVCYFERDVAAPKNPDAAPKNVSVPLTDDEKQYTPSGDTATAKILTNLRSAATTKSSVVGTLKNGDTLVRIAVGKNGWSKLEYNGQTVYAISSYLTTDLTPAVTDDTGTPDEDIVGGCVFTPQSDSVRAKNTVNLRALPSTDSDIVGTLSSDSFLPRTAVTGKGWSRLTYNGKDVYAVTSYLTTDPALADGETQPPAPPVSTGFAPVDEQVTAKEETNLRTAPSTVNSEIVYTLKNGEYVKRTGVHTNGWSRLEYNGQVVYAVSSYLELENQEG